MVNTFLQEYIHYSNVVNKAISESNTRSLEAFIEVFDRHMEILSEHTKIALKTLGFYGWYIPSLEHYVSYPFDLAEQLINNNEKYVDQEMVRMIRKNFKTFSKNIMNNNPKRKHILDEAFEAHKSQKYALSVPVFLTQADGICNEITKYGLFFKDKRTPKTKSYVDNLNKNSFYLSYLEPLRLVLPVIFSDKFIDENVKFNRHKILHGEDCNYDNEVTSSKAFSLLSYINTFLHN